MNLSNHPQLYQLKQILASYDDEIVSHVLYVDRKGNVLIEPFICTLSSNREINNLYNVQFRFELFPQGGGYIGQEAAQDEMYLVSLYRALTKNWHERMTGCINDW